MCFILIIFNTYLNITIDDIMEERKPMNFHRAWGVTEFAMLYFPDRRPETAYRGLSRWIRDCRGLKQKLTAAGWAPFQKVYTPKQVACLIEHLGEP